MIRPLRQRHRWVITVLAIFVPAAFVAGVVARIHEPVMQSPLEVFSKETPSFTTVVWESSDLWPNHHIATRLLSDAHPGGEYAIELTRLDDLVKPDLLLYWSKDLHETNTLPEDAILLGFITPQAPNLLPLPKDFAMTKGMMIIYSLADHETVATSSPVGATTP